VEVKERMARMIVTINVKWEEIKKEHRKVENKSNDCV
jgi:hypothetical protein